MAPVGFSPERAPEGATTREAMRDAALPEPSPVPGDFRSSMVRMRERFVSAGHAERFDAIVWANGAARAAWSVAGDMPDGAMLVEELIDRDRRGERFAGLLVMDKAAASWRFTAVGPAGEVVTGDRLTPCATCHREAPRDSVFGR
jgi:hypothetical protein